MGGAKRAEAIKTVEQAEARKCRVDIAMDGHGHGIVVLNKGALHDVLVEYLVEHNSEKEDSPWAPVRAVLVPHQSPLAWATTLDHFGDEVTWVRVSARWFSADFENEFDREYRSREFTREADYWVAGELHDEWSGDVTHAWIRAGDTMAGLS